MLFDNRWQARKVRWLSWAFLLWTLLWLVWAWSLANSYGLSPGDGGVLRPLHERLIAAGILVSIAILPTAGMLLFGSIYLVRIEREGDDIRLTTLGWLRPVVRRYHTDDFAGAAAHEGRLTARSSVHAPWLALRVAGQRLPFVVDRQAELVDTTAIERLAAAGSGRDRRERKRRAQGGGG